MIQIKVVRDIVLKGLSDYTEKVVILSEQEGKKPRYPYTAMKFTTPGATVGRGTQYMKDGRMVNEEDIEMVLSITCYDSTVDGATDLAYSVLSFFKATGWLYLQDNNIAISEVSDITDRTSFLTTDWEYKVGLDVRLRVRGGITHDVDIIESVYDIKNNIIIRSE